jgi:hypothetical protein
MLRVLQQGMEGRAAQILRCIYTLHFVKCIIRKYYFYIYTIHTLYLCLILMWVRLWGLTHR